MPLSIGSFRILRFYCSYFFCFSISAKTAVNSICLRTCLLFFLRLCFKAGAKLKLLFVSRKKNLKKIWNFFFRLLFLNFPSSLSMNFRVLRGANVKAFFKSHKLFLIFFLKNFSVLISFPASVSVNVFRCCGCKSSHFIYIYKTFFYIFSIFFTFIS